MQIQWHGLGCFSISGKPVNNEVSLVIDPYTDDFGLKAPKGLRGSMVLSSIDEKIANNSKIIALDEGQSEVFLVNHAGEYEVSGVFVNGIHAPLKDGRAHTIYRIFIEGLSVAYLGNLDRVLKDKEIELLGDVNILILPVGGENVLNAKQANEVVAQVEPRVIIPSHYAIKGADVEWVDHDAFCKEIACPVKNDNKFKMTKSSLPVEDMELIVLNKS